MEKNEQTVINYNNVFSSCYKKDTMVCSHSVKEHSLIYINSGLLKLNYNNKTYTFKKGDCIFIKRSHDVQLTKMPLNNNEPFSGVFFIMNREFLSSKFKKYKNLDYEIEKEPIVPIISHPVLASFFDIFNSYRETGIRPDDEIIELKKSEALDILLKIKPTLVKSIFDFAKPWKIDLQDFMNKNYTNDMSIEEFAHYTGRSLSTFKRDFKEIFNESPHEWLKNKKLDQAYKLMKENKLKASDVYIDLGFKTLSHFSDSFKEKFGIRPSSI